MTHQTYPSFEAIVERYERRRDPIKGAHDGGIPPLDTSFDAAKTTIIEQGGKGFQFASFEPPAQDRPPRYNMHSKEFEGQPELLMLHALVISHLRKREQPAHAAPMFHRMWREEREFLLAHLETRWLISAAITFGDCGETEIQRIAGRGLDVFFSTLKIYEWDLRKSFKPIRFDAHTRVDMPMGLPQFSNINGDLDYNLIARVFSAGAGDPIMEDLCETLFARLNADEDLIFARMMSLRERLNRDVV